ncbi:Proteasome subunit alpha type [Pyrenophora tritici-repentis]|uniref:ATP-synt-Eps domain containing protein n=5 Tax=Pyrenophora TaxID=5027 RepID=A0A2W1ENG1_9PLEO|nr:Proteasome subunit alpha type [Pyrenophora tritici-repentis]KAF7448686.1 Proteasome protein [Pyrenophora tritici-repentis]KAF7572409.1 ATP-synt-Eps domain containing protein [Pyrenophora tritici-repentis]KAI0570700.1 Proteasome subunit alpha type [Pyrenophora tritici-repentis]KAI0577940.1 Proteasome subunit alpha type [Pyrenophora tritici-repentis]
MFRNNYDNDSVTFSPQGRIFQVEYAQEAVKQGSVVVGIVSKTHAVLAAIKRNAEELSSYQKKIIPIDSHFGVALAGLASDARVLSNFMKQQSLASRLTYDRAIPLSEITSRIADRAQTNTQQYGRRPYGVGLLIAGVDAKGPHLFEFQPSGVTQEMIACGIGARSQMARTYLERHLDDFEGASREELIKHALRALKESLSQDKELTVDNTSVGIGGVGEDFALYEGQDITEWLDATFENREGDDDAEGGDVLHPQTANPSTPTKPHPIITMAFAWKAAGLTYNRYIAVASRVVRRSLKEDKRIAAERRGESELRFAKWSNGKQGEMKDLNAAALQAQADAAKSS